jgi:hypothetical protein
VGRELADISRYMPKPSKLCHHEVVYVYVHASRTHVFVHVVHTGVGLRTMGPSRGYHSSGPITAEGVRDEKKSSFSAFETLCLKRTIASLFTVRPA